MDNCKGKQIDILIYSTAKRFTLKKNRCYLSVSGNWEIR